MVDESSRLNLTTPQKREIMRFLRGQRFRGRFVGIDKRGRPVVSAFLDEPDGGRVKIAVTEDGSATPPEEPVHRLDLEAMFGPRPGRVS